MSDLQDTTEILYWHTPVMKLKFSLKLLGFRENQISCFRYIKTFILSSRPVEMKKSSEGAGSLSKNVSQFGHLTKKIVQLKSFKMPRNT